MFTVQDAKQLAYTAHRGQKRWGGEPYITHPERVAKAVDSDEEKMVAWMHDVLEDSDTTKEYISLLGCPANVLDAVVAITKTADDKYLDYILRVKANKLARVVKIADVEDNLTNLKKGSTKDKYQLALYILENEL